MAAGHLHDSLGDVGPHPSWLQRPCRHWPAGPGVLHALGHPGMPAVADINLPTGDVVAPAIQRG